MRDKNDYLVHLLRVLAERGPNAPNNIYDIVADRAQVPAEERLELCKDGFPAYKNRMQFARQGLVDAGLILGPSEPGWKRGVWELNRAGNALAREYPSDAQLDPTLRTMVVQGERARAQARSASRALAGLEDDESETPPVTAAQPAVSAASPALAPPSEAPTQDSNETSIKELVDRENELALRTMLDHVRTLDDRAFEYLVGQVLKAALRAESVRITRKSRDGGYDGILSFDDLGLRVAVFEVKRYQQGSAVSRSQIDAFATAARRLRAAHSLFVTSSHFSPEAIEAAKAEGIRLVDGTAFVELMARHGFGLRERETYVVYELDPAWSVDTDSES